MSEIFMASKRSMVYRNTVVDIGDGSAEEVTKAMEMVDKGIVEERFKRWAEFLKNHPVHLVRTDEDERKEHAERLAESIQWTRLTNTLDDIRDLLYVNSLNQSAMLQLMVESEDHKTSLSRRYAISENLRDGKRILNDMLKRQERTKRQLESMTQKYELAKRRSDDGSET